MKKYVVCTCGYITGVDNGINPKFYCGGKCKKTMRLTEAARILSLEEYIETMKGEKNESAMQNKGM